ncbi:Signal transduction histidine kinase [Modicisalibacter xianhensis]|uniref:histidine kinase n=2 Tax=Modicisalibacter xianhensis TaxID=442341 RepID=A0A1I3GNG3_9GAMM|nr:Signal transduction histidine kinase [Halomonas xianhensis]
MYFLRIDPRSLRFHLLTRLGLVALVVVGVTWLLHGMLLRDLAREFLADRLRQEAHYTIERLQQNGGPPIQWLESDSLASEVFHHLYVLRVGDQVSSSHPDRLSLLSPYLDETKAEVFEVPWQGRKLLIYREALTLEGQQGVLLIGEDFAQVESGLDALHWWVGAIAGALLVLLILLNLIAVNRSLRPLAFLQRQLSEIQSGQRERLDLDVPSELDSLIAQLNHFMDELQRRLLRSREAVANLSHTLQTPLAAVTQVLRGSRPIDEQRRHRMLERMEGMQAQLASELRRARFAGPMTGQRANVIGETEMLIDMMRTLYPVKRFELQVSLSPNQNIAVERHDLNEMLGIVLDNGGKWARECVLCHIYKDQDLVIDVQDDGRGVDSSALPELGQRGKRLDESTPGHGLGLAILKQIVAQYRGRVTFSSPPGGGFHVRIVLPINCL